MMKEIALSAILFCLSMSMMAQNEKGTFSIRPVAGLNIATLNESNGNFCHTKTGVTAGLEFEYGVSRQVGLSIGMMFSQQGAEIDGSTEEHTFNQGIDHLVYSETQGKLRSNYINIPLLVNYYIAPLKGLAVKAGVQLGIRADDRLKCETQTVEANQYQDNVPVYTNTLMPYARYSQNTMATDVCKSIDFGFPIGLSYELKGVMLDARYYFGLADALSASDAKEMHNRYLSITLSYRFHL